MRTHTLGLLKKSQIQKKTSLLDVFVGNSATPISNFANNKRSYSKKWKILGQNCVFLFFRRKFWHDSVTPFSTVANITGSLPTNTSTTPDRLRQTVKAVFGQLSFRRSQKKKVSQKVPPLVLIYTPKEAHHSRVSRPAGQYSCDKCSPKKNNLLGAASL